MRTLHDAFYSKTYLHFLLQSRSSIHTAFHHFFSDREIFWQLLTALDDVRIYAVQEHWPEYLVGHPSVIFDYLQPTTIKALKDLFKIIEIVPAVENCHQITETEF